MSEEEKKQILDQHKNAEKKDLERKEELKRGLQKPETKEPPKTDPKPAATKKAKKAPK